MQYSVKNKERNKNWKLFIQEENINERKKVCIRRNENKIVSRAKMENKEENKLRVAIIIIIIINHT